MKTHLIYTVLSVKEMEKAIAELKAKNNAYGVFTGEMYNDKKLISKEGEKQANLSFRY